MQEDYNYHTNALDSNKFFDGVKGIDMDYTYNAIKGFFDNYNCTFEAEKDSNRAHLKFTADKQSIAAIMKLLQSNGFLVPVK